MRWKLRKVTVIGEPRPRSYPRYLPRRSGARASAHTLPFRFVSGAGPGGKKFLASAARALVPFEAGGERPRRFAWLRRFGFFVGWGGGLWCGGWGGGMVGGRR